MIENLSLAVVDSETTSALRIAVQLWAEATTRAETFNRAEKLRDKLQAVGLFFSFARKHPGDVTPEDVRAWRTHLESRGRSLRPSTRGSRASPPSSNG